MKKTCPVILFFILFTPVIKAQDYSPDSLRLLDSITVKSFDQYRQPLYAGVQVSHFSMEKNNQFNTVSLVSAVNTMAGVRMEERSPASYRINIRGSSLRSPFGVRNIKVYWNDLPVTDPGGNTYFNQFAWNNFSNIELFKGPAASMYGAGTGGLILLTQFTNNQPGIKQEISAGSFGLLNVLTTASFGNNNIKNQLTFAHQQADGFRDHSVFRRDNFSFTSQIKYSPRAETNVAVLYTDLGYQTPGALTWAEYNANPRASRPGSGVLPSAVQAKAAIYQQNLLGGFTQQYFITPQLKNTTSLYGFFTELKNPAIRNYERRMEPSFGGRSVFRFEKKAGTKTTIVNWGAEFQEGLFNTQVSKNKNGNPDTLQTNDDIKTITYNLFAQVTINIKDNWSLLAGGSITKTNVEFTRMNIYPVSKQKRVYRNEISPRLSLVHNWNKKIFWLASLSRGFSPPTTAELLPSTGVISTNLEAEEGWNYETTLRLFLFKSMLHVELTGYTFRLRNALVPRRDPSGADFFVNAGDLQQRGLELHMDFSKNPLGGFFDFISVKTDLALQHFRYGSFIKDGIDFSGMHIPSVPAITCSVQTDLVFHKGFSLGINYYGSSRIYLNDANTVYANAYYLAGCRAEWKKPISKKYFISLYTGADNLLNEKYSLGNDINAAGGRYYNTAPTHNYYTGFLLQAK